MAHKVDRKKGILTSINPSTLQELGQIPLATPEDVEIAVQNAKAAFPSWAALTIQERAKHLIRARDYMLDRVEEICKLLTDEAGKPRSEALTAEVLVVSDLINLYTKRAPELLADRPIPLANPLLRHLKNARLAYEPLGVVAVVSPWNYPFSIPMSGILMSLLAGNTVVFKPASDTAMIGKKIEEILNIGGGLPPGVLNTLIATGSTMGEKLFSPPVKKVVFTGSTEVGKMVHSIAA
ncbi:MAG TPA: aldehyde dehydrogenase family protein, partial [Myxococcota bacterium]|nr:aldehyde dehydrogenase family protein [Myxococcota bacterium]